MNVKRSNNYLVSVCAAAATIFVAGCADMNMGNMSPGARNTAVGAGVGALAGAAIGGNTKGAAIGGLLGAAGGYVWSQQMAEKKASMERATQGTGVAVTQTQDNRLKLNIPSDISFDTGRADIKPNLRPILDQFANGLANQPNTEIRIVGHTDNVGSNSTNDPLSMHRAQSARDYLSSRGVDPRRVFVEGQGERDPIADNNSAMGRASNRRVEIFLAERSGVAGR